MTTAEEAMRKFPVQGKISKEWIVPESGYAAFEMTKGQVLRFVDIKGKQVPDLVCFNLRTVEST